MEAENQSALPSCHSSPNDSSSSSSDSLTQENPLESFSHLSPTPGTVIPNRIFVGGIDHRFNEDDLREVFSRYGAVRDVKIITDRLGISKRYGFVTFETQEDALRIINTVNGICFKEKKLCIGQAVRKYHTTGKAKNPRFANLNPALPHQMSYGTFYLTTSTGHPYTYHKGVAYFHCPVINPLTHQWPVIVPKSQQPVHPQQPPLYHHYQDVPNQYQWNIPQVPIAFSAAMYSQQSEYPYQCLDGSSYVPPLPAVDGTIPEFVESTEPQFYSGMTPMYLQHDPRENQLFPPPRLHLKPKYWRYMHHKDYYHLPESTELPDASAFPFHVPHVG